MRFFFVKITIIVWILGLTIPSHAAVLYLSKDNGSGTNWLTAEYWKNASTESAAIPSSGDTCYVPGACRLRTPANFLAASINVFPATLYVGYDKNGNITASQAQVLMKGSATVNELYLGNGILVNNGIENNDGGDANLYGNNIYIQTAVFQTTVPSTAAKNNKGLRNLVVYSSLKGDATASLTVNALYGNSGQDVGTGGFVAIRGTGNAYAGRITVGKSDVNSNARPDLRLETELNPGGSVGPVYFNGNSSMTVSAPQTFQTITTATDSKTFSKMDVSGATATVTENFAIHALTVGQDKDAANSKLIIESDSATIGTETVKGDVNIGYKTIAGTVSGSTYGELDLSSVKNVDIYANNIRVGNSSYTSESPWSIFGRLKLGESNRINADSLVIADSAYAGLGEPSSVSLGNENVLRMNSIIIGGRKGKNASVTIASGGTLDLDVLNAGGVTLNVGSNTVSTGVAQTVNLDLSNAGEVRMTNMDTITVGNKTGGSTGKSTATFNAGDNATIVAKKVILGTGTKQGTEQASGTLSLGGDSVMTITEDLQMATLSNHTGIINLTENAVLKTAALTVGEGTATLNQSGGSFQIDGTCTPGRLTHTWTGGTFDVGTYGGTLQQNNANTVLSPGLEMIANMTVAGDYLLSQGVLKLQIGDGVSDVLHVGNDISFTEDSEILLSLEYDPTESAWVELITAGGDILYRDNPITDMDLAAILSPDSAANWNLQLWGGGGIWAVYDPDPANVPEPATWILMFSGFVLSRFFYRRRRV